MSEPKKILLLHGNRQTGQLLLGRMDKLRKKLQKLGIVIVAPDAPFQHPDDTELRTWWNRDGSNNVGLEQSIRQIQEVWDSGDFVGVMGFSQGARLVHFVNLLNHARSNEWFSGKRFSIMVAGYDAPIPDELLAIDKVEVGGDHLLLSPSLHVWGETDKLITPCQSNSVSEYYRDPKILEHDGGHHVPMRAANVAVYLAFIQDSLGEPSVAVANTDQIEIPIVVPDEETAQTQADEVEAISAIFPDEFHLLSGHSEADGYNYPVVYRVDLPTSDEGTWPPKPLALQIKYPPDYPTSSMSPEFHLHHDNNVMEFSSVQVEMCLDVILKAARSEEGMPCVMTMIYAARDFFESGGFEDSGLGQQTVESNQPQDDGKPIDVPSHADPINIRKASPSRILECNLQGLAIAERVLQSLQSSSQGESHDKGGSWGFTIGLVGKPSAGKSTFFNAASAFARQRDDKDNPIGGASMAPHPFTTIDPNVGYCLVPAPAGSCPEEDFNGSLPFGSTHGRDHLGRRLLPVLLKDVAGLVPGAYKGRGRGNKFLHDLTGADVLIHVVDASGTADNEGNSIGLEEDGSPSSGTSNPMEDLAWIRNELIEWVYTNLMDKWGTIRRKGTEKLIAMFSGYGQSQYITDYVCTAVEDAMQLPNSEGVQRTPVTEWDEGDIRRLISAFLGVRFPMALALNKYDIPSASSFVKDLIDALPVHGVHTAVPLCSRTEMEFVKDHVEKSRCIDNKTVTLEQEVTPPCGVWECLNKAMCLREPLLIFPVLDFEQYLPLPGLNQLATGDPSLPSVGMLSCIEAAGGCLPSAWNADKCIYNPHSTRQMAAALRDVLIMKHGSTLENVFLALKNRGALGGELVRAEAAGNIGEAPRPIPKQQLLSKKFRIIKIMTNKRTTWQS